MHSFIEYVRRNIMFVVILTAIILVTAGLVIYQMVLAAPTKGDTQEPADTTQSVEPGSSETAIVGFSGRMSSDDVIVLRMSSPVRFTMRMRRRAISGSQM